MAYPRLTIDLEKLKDNVSRVVQMGRDQGVDIYVVSKVFKAMPQLVRACIQAGVSGIADSRLENLERIKDFEIPKMLLRIPMLSEVDRVVALADVSLNSELVTIKALDQAAQKQGKKHQIILMVDLGDLREGFLPDQVVEAVEDILKCRHIELVGLGVNLTCYGGVIPTPEKLSELIVLKDKLEKRFSIQLPVVSGGNSSSFYLLENQTLPKAISQLRVGETIVLGRETAYGKLVDHLHHDIFSLEAQVIECKEKGSVPKGEIGMNAFGERPVFVDKGTMKRGILAIGRQDVSIEGLWPKDPSLEIIGASSDHMILDMTHTPSDYKVGDIIGFDLDYGALLELFTSEFVDKCVLSSSADND